MNNGRGDGLLACTPRLEVKPILSQVLIPGSSSSAASTSSGRNFGKAIFMTCFFAVLPFGSPCW